MDNQHKDEGPEDSMERLRSDLYERFATRPILTNPATIDFLESLKGDAR